MKSGHQDGKTEPASKATVWDFVLVNRPFDMSDWTGEDQRQDMRWKFGMPPVNNAELAWIEVK